MINNLFAPLAMKVSGGIILSLIAALGIVMWRADALSEARDEAQRAFVTEQAKHAVTQASLTSLTTRMETLVKEGQLRRERLTEALELADRDAADLLRQAEQLEAGEIDITQVEGL